jgi:hypothetical protein
MKYLSKFSSYIKEAKDETEEVKSPDADEYKDLQEEITELIKKSLKSEDEKVFDDFIESSTKDPDEVQIESLINDSDIYDFYLKWRNEIDDVLSDINYYDNIPSENKVFSLYDYIIQGTRKAISEVILMLKK